MERAAFGATPSPLHLYCIFNDPAESMGPVRPKSASTKWPRTGDTRSVPVLHRGFRCVSKTAILLGFSTTPKDPSPT
jgi:hypothetical protein